MLELASKWSASKDSVGCMNACNDLLWAVFGWMTAGRVIMYGKSECKVNTNVFNVYSFNPAQVFNVIAELLQKQGG